MTDSYTIFEDVFIPWERIFLCGATQHGGILALLFALYHRHSYSGCKPALSEIMVGTVALAFEDSQDRYLFLDILGQAPEKFKSIFT